ncbi:hypothetical protein Lesp02_71490 [Lentzea sp. NBRC 105346]|uniref:winged helix DNA-binding domain-containing protein n=1 Tax=Lentzea sp. NBRC 105346 TaxID=3032205 RepID=UPI0024A3CD7C|nr:winged helix DNA-binding domain-containing protein [Lentzea sp. NBRC 105346]GLZ34962.1 hypothetical protein Lesp02_71490 [Lentzea sp. NBRC 105346]
MDPAAVRAARIKAQRLDRPPGSVTDLVRGIVALQAQDLKAARLAVRARTNSLTPQDFDDAVASGALVRTWAMRGTLHLIAREDVGWIVTLLGPVNAEKGRRRRMQLGLDDDFCARAIDQLRDILVEPLGRKEIVRRLGERGIRLEGQMTPHLLGYAANLGIITAGDDSYELLGTPKLKHGLPELVRRYMDAYGPATAEDFATWSGLPLKQVREVFPAELPEFEPAEPCVRLLGHFDPFLLGYRDRSAHLAAEHVSAIQTGGGFLTPHVLVNGEVRGTWTRRGKIIDLTPFGPIPQRPLKAEVDSLVTWY